MSIPKSSGSGPLGAAPEDCRICGPVISTDQYGRVIPCGHNSVPIPLTARARYRCEAIAIIEYARKMGTGNVLLSIEQAEALL